LGTNDGWSLGIDDVMSLGSELGCEEGTSLGKRVVAEGDDPRGKNDGIDEETLNGT